MAGLTIWVGSDKWQRRAGAEQVLEHSIRKHATCPVEIVWMRAGDPGWEATPDGRNGSWKIGREPDQAWPKRGWGTDFSNFRLAIPELAKFTGRHVYMDVDMIVLGDVAEFAAMTQKGPWMSTSMSRTDVSLIDAAAFAGQTWWPSLEFMKSSGTYLHQYRDLLMRKGFLSDRLDPRWNCVDTWPDNAKLIHLSSVPHQVYRPYPKVVYREHPNVAIKDLWFETLREAKAVEAKS